MICFWLKCSFKKLCGLWSVLVITLVILVGWVIIPSFIRCQIANRMVISPEINPEYYNAWLESPIPVYLKVYIFSVTNPEEIVKGSKPRLKEIGPYVFQEFRKKVDISSDEELDTLTYKEHITYKFRTDLSGNLSLSDTVTIINVPFAAAAIKIQLNVPWLLRHMAHMILLNYKEPLFINKTVEEIFFKGWKVPFLDRIEEEIGLTMLENNTFGFFVGMNDTDQGPYTIRRGIKGDKSLLGSMTHYKNKSKLDIWLDVPERCNEVVGTDGTIFPANLNKDSIFKVFSPDVCSSLYFEYKEDVKFKGIPGFRFIAPLSLSEDSRVLYENKCYCENIDTNPDSCMSAGALDLGTCKDAPVAMSKPHFLDANPKYLSAMGNGVAPDPARHLAYIDVEPRTGIYLRARKNIQINLIMKKVPNIPSLAKVNDGTLLPLIWANENAELESPYSDRVRTVVFWIDLVENIGRWGLPIATLVIICMYYYIRSLKISQGDQKCNNKSQLQCQKKLIFKDKAIIDDMTEESVKPLN